MSDSKKPTWIIDSISIAVVVVVGILLAMPNKFSIGEWTSQLPHVIGVVNTITCVFLVLGFITIKKRNIAVHRVSMVSAFSLGIIFLILYILYHSTNPPVRIGAEGPVRWFYLIVLLTHILLSMIVLPLVLRAMYFAVTGQFERHQRVAKYALPIWLYVSVTGVIVYLMVHQIYANVSAPAPY